VPIDFLVGKTNVELDNNTVKRIQDIQKLDSDDKAHVFALLNAFIQSQKAKNVFVPMSLIGKKKPKPIVNPPK
jgi:hypothetical protein